MHTRLVFTALQRLILARELDRADPALPASSAEVVAYLKTHTPVAPAFLDEVAAEHARALAGAGAGIHACFPKLHELVRVFLGALDRGESLERLAAVNDLPDRARLTISAVVITRNRCAYLSRCLEAMLRVDRAPDEILVVDNGSTDATREVVERWSAVRPIRYILEPALGVARARNAGSRAARGEILAFLDDDAVPTAGWLAALEHAFLKSRTIGIVGGAIHHFRNDRDDAVSTYYRLQEGPEPC
ncbi:MAG: glycosyltransferase family 2 protein [Planctomycetes bacterium]|nr:glycosyltransferase family 2 protein [Planctomycetota bacterium]